MVAVRTVRLDGHQSGLGATAGPTLGAMQKQRGKLVSFLAQSRGNRRPVPNEWFAVEPSPPFNPKDPSAPGPGPDSPAGPDRPPGPLSAPS